MMAKWTLIEDLLGGTAAMRAARDRWLPMEEAETDANYESRLGRSILYNMFKDTVLKLAAKPFARAVTVKGLPAEVEYILTDADGRGRTFTEVLYASLFDMMAYGLTEARVDFTHLPPKPDGSKYSIAEEKAAGARAYIKVTRPSQVIGWRFIPNVEPPQLESVRIEEMITEAKGKYQDREVRHVWEVYADHWFLHRQDPDDKAKWDVVREGSNDIGHVPLHVAYADEASASMEANPPLEDLAYVNLAHWQSDSDQRNILRMCRFAILFLKGLSDEDYEDATGQTKGKGPLIIGPTNFVKTRSPDAEMKYVEHTGAGIDAGRQDLLSLEARGEKLGSQPLAQTSTTRTAAGANIDESRNLSLLQRWVRTIEAHGRRLLEAVLAWHKIKTPADLIVDVYSDFKVTLYDDDDAKLLKESAAEGLITVSSYLHELKRRGKLPEAFDVDQEVAALETLRLDLRIPETKDAA